MTEIVFSLVIGLIAGYLMGSPVKMCDEENESAE